MLIKAEFAKRETSAYWDKVNLYSVVWEDIRPISNMIQSAACKGKSFVVLKREHLPDYFYCEVYKDVEPNENIIMCKRRQILLDLLSQAGYKIKLQTDDRLVFGEHIVVEW